jgi:putative hydrolase of the HAD superfamily
LRDARTTFGFDGGDVAFNETWLKSAAVRRFECGDIDRNAFSTLLVRELQLPYGDEEFLRRFEQWPKALYPGITDLLDELPDTVATALLSNTNAVHWNRGDIGNLLRPRLDHLFLSFETGHLKPDGSAFHQLLDYFECSAGQILFVDDNALNITAASQLGISAYLTRGADQLRSRLARERVIFDTAHHDR